MKYYIGIDLGGTFVKAGVVDENYNIIAKASVDSADVSGQPEKVADRMAECAKAALEKANLTMDDVENIGIGAPGSVDPDTGMIIYANNLNFLNTPMRAYLEARTGKKIYLENDANVAAYGEVLAGAAKGYNDAIVITLGTGVGGGIIIDGKIFAGFNYAGAELGHMVIQKDGRACMCGRNGCWEKYASARALTEDTKAAMLSHPDNMMWKLVDGDVNKVNAKTAFQGMRAGDELAKRLIDKYVEYVACGLTNVINIFQPEIVCIGGGVSREGEVLLGPVRRQVDWEDYARDGKRRVKIKAAELFNDAGVVGAARLGDQVKT